MTGRQRRHGPDRGAALAPLLLVCTILAGCGDAEPAREDPIVARVDGAPILLSEIERRAAWPLHRARLDVHILLDRETESLIDERLLERTARQRGVDVDSLLRDAESGAPPIAESDVDDYLATHPDDVPDAQARPRIRLYLEERQRLERRIAFLSSLREAADVEILLEPPPRPRSELDLRGAPARGPGAAPITIVHFADLRRADSARVARDIVRLERALPGKLRVVARSLPRERDELGLLTAQLAAAAQTRGLFWKLHDRLAQSGGVASPSDLEAAARSIGLDDVLPSLSADRESLLRVKQDLEHAREAGARRAPTLFVNGRYFMGLEGYEALRVLVDDELRSAGRDQAATRRD